MRKFIVISAALFLLNGVAIAGEVSQSETQVKEKTTHSTSVQDDGDQTGGVNHESTTIEKRKTTETSGSMGAHKTTHKKVEVEKNHSHMSTEKNEDLPGTTEYHQQTETRHEHSTTEVK